MAVDVVPAGGVFVAVPVPVPVPVADVVDVELVVGDVELEVVVLDVELVVELVECVVLVAVVQLLTSWLTVAAPSPRSRSSVGLTEEPRRETAAVKALAALDAVVQSWELRAAEIELSCPLSVPAAFADSRPFPLPQATTKAAAKPSPPAKNAREPKPIRA